MGVAINVRISRAFGATLMVAILACQGPAIEWSVTLVAESARPLYWLTAEEFLFAGPVKNGQRADRGSSRPLEVFIHANRRALGLPLPTVLLGPLRWIPWAFLATGMLAGDAHLLGAKRDVTPMTGTAYANAHDLFHSLRISAGRGCPFTRFELESVLDENRTSFLFLNCIAGSSGLGQSLTGLCESRLGVLDRLLQRSRNRGYGRSPGLGNRFRGRGQRGAADCQLRKSTAS